MTGRTMIVALLALMLAACSNSGREPLLEQDGTIQEADSADSGGSAADVTEMDDTTVADGPQDVTTPPQDATLVDISAPDQTIPVDIVGPKDAAPFEIAPADVVPEVIPVDIVPQGPTCGDIFK